MSDENKKDTAQQMIDILCRALDNRNWRYTREDVYTVRFGAKGEDIPMMVFICADEKRQVIKLRSMMPFDVDTAHFADAAVACCLATNRLPDGYFYHSRFSQSISFRMTSTYRNCEINELMFDYMIDYACTITDEYNDIFEAILYDQMDICELYNMETEIRG